MSGHEHAYEGAWWHYVTMTDARTYVFVRLCAVEDDCAAFQEARVDAGALEGRDLHDVIAESPIETVEEAADA